MIGPLVSVVIPNYNHARFVGDAIRSVLNQSFCSYEIIVVDDGSTDDSREVIEKFGGRVRGIYQENAGLSAARNAGIRAAQGAFIGLLDADDMYEPNYLGTLVNALESRPDAEGVYCGYRFVDENNSALPQIENRPVSTDALHDALLDGNFLVPESIFLRRRVFEAVGLFDEALHACEDWDVWLRITKKFRIIHNPGILTRHRIVAGSMSTDPFRMLTARLAVLNKLVGGRPLSGASTRSHRAYGRAYLGSCVEYLQNGDGNRAYECFQRMAEICPVLLTEVDTYYQLGCGNQPKGRMGDLQSLNLKKNGAKLFEMMEKLYADDSTSNNVRRLKPSSYAKAYYSLGLLAYGKGEHKEARQYFLSAIACDFRILFRSPVVPLWAKSRLNGRLMDWLRGLRRRIESMR